ncbi:phage integrase family protein [Cupriavidus sp. 8B]
MESGKRSITRQRLHRGHFAYFRGIVQGLAPRQLWDRYLADAGSAEDAQQVHRMSGWIRAELVAAAARGGDFARARLLRLDLAPVVDGQLPTLEDFALAKVLSDFSEAEQIEAYEAAFGTVLTRQRRRTRMLARQLDAISELEAQMAWPARREDGVEAWLVDSLARRLIAQGVPTLGMLHARIAAGGTWWDALRGIGTTKAAALEQFLRGHASTLGPLPSIYEDDEAEPGEAESRAESQVSPWMPGGQLVLPVELDGRQGQFRGPRERCLIGANTDAEAVAAWVAAKAKAKAHRAGRATSGAGERPLTCTQLAYRREGERLLLWAVLERRKALSSLTLEDAIAYRGFLMAPPPEWCGRQAQPRWKASWRPLAGPLSPRSCVHALGVVANLFAFLVNQGYLIGNPWRGVSPPCEVERGPDVRRGFTHAQWRYLSEQLKALPPGLPAQRLQIALHLLHDTGLRIAELVAATCDDLTWESLVRPPEPPVEGWWLSVVGKADKVRRVPVSSEWVGGLAGYLVARGSPADPRQAVGVALLGRLSKGDGDSVSASSIHRQLKRFLHHCATLLATTDVASASALRRASCHWMRHTHVSHALDAGVPVQVVQQNVGHASLDTTTRYVRTEDAIRHAAMRELWSR